MTDTAKVDSIVIWQSQEPGVSEPAILIEPYSDVMRVTSEGGYIQINYESLEEFVKALRQAAKQRKQ